MADVIAKVADGIATAVFGVLWLMLLPRVADGIATLMQLFGRCYCLGGLDVIATRVDLVLADGIAKSALL